MTELDLVDELISQGNALDRIREPWIPLWKTLTKFCEPGRQFYAPEDSTKSKEPELLYNSRGVLALTQSAAAFQGYTANQHSQWFKLTFTDPLLLRQPGVSDWLEDCERSLYSQFSKGNLYNALGELSPDGHGIGTAYLYTEEEVGRDKIVFQTRHPRALYASEDAHGMVNTVFEDDYMTGKAARERFDDRLDSRMIERAQKDPFAGVTINHAVFPMDERFQGMGRKEINPEMPFLSVWFDKTSKKILDVGGYWEMPYMVWRRAKNSGETYGRSEAMNALGDIKGANQITRSTLALAQLIADPPMLADEDLEGRDTLLPHGRVYVANKDKVFQPIPLGANYPIGVDREERVERIINEHFNINLYLMLQQTEGQMTAREVIERMGEKAALLGYITGRYNSEVLQPLIKRTFNIMLRAGRLPKPPQVILDAKTEGGLDIMFQGFLAQVQQRYYQTSGINASLAYMEAVGKIFGPESLDNVDSDELMREGLESAGCPARIIRELPDVETRRTQRSQAIAAQQAQAQQAQAQATIAQNADKLGKVPQPGSPLEQMSQAAPA